MKCQFYGCEEEAKFQTYLLPYSLRRMGKSKEDAKFLMVCKKHLKELEPYYEEKKRIDEIIKEISRFSLYQ